MITGISTVNFETLLTFLIIYRKDIIKQILAMKACQRRGKETIAIYQKYKRI